MKFFKENMGKIAFLAYSVLLPVVSLAACDPTAGKICDPLEGRFGTIPDFIQTLVKGAIKIGIPLVALAVIYSGFLFVAARGNSEKLGKAKEALMYSLIGAAILLGSWAIAQMISATVTQLSP